MGILFYRLSAIFTAILLFFSLITGILPEKKVQNVILLIGDGMGEMHLDMTEDIRDISVGIKSLPQYGYSMTYSASSSVTDSAAGATALSCGVKTENGRIATYYPEMENYEQYENFYPESLTELCMKNGMKTGVVTTDKLSGATPSCFSAHAESRNNDEDISADQLVSGIDILWGKDSETVTEEQVARAGYVCIDTIDEMNALTGNEKSYAMFSSSLYHTYNKNDYTPTLSQMTEKAIELLDSTEENGFFLMVEGAHIDKKSHNKDEDGAAEALEEFDNAVAKAIEFAENDGHTLVVVTADHETGGVIINDDGEYEMTTGGHTSRDVPVRAFGPYEFIEDGEVIENIYIPLRITQALEFEEGCFPATRNK